MNYEGKGKFVLLSEMGIEPYNSGEFYFFESKPSKSFSETTLEGCLAHQSRVEQMKER